MPAPLVRLPDWPRRLARMFRASSQIPFQWGYFDCALHVCNCIKAITVGNIDPGASYRGTYSTQVGAEAIFGSDLGVFAATIAATYSMPEKDVTFARRGDVVFVDNGTADGALGVVGLDPRFAVCAAASGLVTSRMSKWRRAWWVG